MISPRLVLTLVLAACGGKSPPPTVQNEVAPQPAPAPAPPPKSENEVVMEKMRGFTDGMCACKDKVCADKVQEGMSAWAQQVARDAGDKPSPTPTEAELKAMTEVGQRYGECMTAAMSAP
jgi:hypothetical protein